MPIESTRFSLAAVSLDADVQDAVKHLQEVVEGEGLRGFVAPVLERESFERIDGVWTRVFRFKADLIPERSKGGD